MSRITRLRHAFVESFPEPMKPGMLYISLTYSCAGHLCCCGCENEVITPLAPTDWKMIFDGETVSLHPSIGSFKLDCKSHYYISRGVVEWSGAWSDKRVATARRHDESEKREYYKNRQKIAVKSEMSDVDVQPKSGEEMPTGLWLRMQKLWK